MIDHVGFSPAQPTPGGLTPTQRTGKIPPVGRPTQGDTASSVSPTGKPPSTSPVEGTLQELEMQSLESLLPEAILRSGRWLETEWAWRRIMFQVENVTTQAKDLQTLWRLLGQFARTVPLDAGGNASLAWRFEVGQWPFSSLVVPFTQVNLPALKSLPQRLAPLVLADRLQSSVESSQLPFTGEGLFLVENSGPQQQGAAIRWHAERQTRVGALGQVVHRLELTVQVGREPVRISMLFAEPHLDLHFSTDHPILRDSLLAQAEKLRLSLTQIGVNTNRIQTGPLREENVE